MSDNNWTVDVDISIKPTEFFADLVIKKLNSVEKDQFE